MKVQVGQRWYWKTSYGSSEVIFEVEKIAGTMAELRYVQIVKKGYPIDVVGNIDRLTIYTIENSSPEFTYLEGQDRPA